MFMESHISSFTHFPSWESINRWEDTGGTRPRIDSSLLTDPCVQYDWCDSSSSLLCMAAYPWASWVNPMKDGAVDPRPENIMNKNIQQTRTGKMSASNVETASPKRQNLTSLRSQICPEPESFHEHLFPDVHSQEHTNNTQSRGQEVTVLQICKLLYQGALSPMLMLRSCVCRVQFSQDPRSAS